MRDNFVNHLLGPTAPNLIFALGIFLGVLSVINKLLLLANRRTGWVSGMVIGLLSSIFFYSIGLIILAVAELGFFAVMLYGYLSNTKRSKIHDFVFSALLTGISLFLANARFAGEITIYELISSLSFIWGGYGLAVSKRFLGWLLLLCAHTATSLASYLAGETIFSVLQVVSGIVCIFGLTGVRMPRHSTGED